MNMHMVIFFENIEAVTQLLLVLSLGLIIYYGLEICIY